MSSKSDWRGVYVIVTTPFDDDLRIDWDGLRSTMRFCVDAKVHGVVATANASEVGYLSDEERREVARIVVEEAKGKATAVVGISSSSWILSQEHARHAAELGADAVMAMPPTFQKPSEGEIREFYARLSDASGLPIFIQNYAGPGGNPMSPQLVGDILRDVENARFVKEETEFSPIMMSEILKQAGDKVESLMGGKAGIRLLDEYRRGATGTMPACEVSDVHVALWNALEAGEEKRAREVYRLLLPLLSFEVGYGPAIYKEVLRRRGVISSSRFRQTGGRVLDANSMIELDGILEDLRPLMTTALPRPVVETAAQ